MRGQLSDRLSAAWRKLQQTQDERRENTSDMDWIATAAGQSRHCGAPAVVCERSFFNHSVQPWSSF